MNTHFYVDHEDYKTTATIDYTKFRSNVSV